MQKYLPLLVSSIHLIHNQAQFHLTAFKVAWSSGKFICSKSIWKAFVSHYINTEGGRKIATLFFGIRGFVQEALAQLQNQARPSA